jgi:DNA-binding CsgD family transcriptional regulator
MLLGRDREQAMVVRLLQDARASRSGVLAVVGEAGIGKSALLAYAQEQAAGMNVLRARGVQSEAHIPFAGLFELLRPALGCISQIPDPQAAALESALALRPAASSQDRFAIGAATLSLLAGYAESDPVAILLDDMHSIDGSSADALLFAFRRLVADPVAVVLTVREGEPSLLDGADLETLRLTGLDRASAAELLRREVAEPVSEDLADRLQAETAGNPLALLELAQDLSWLNGAALGVPLAAGTSVAGVYVQRFRSLPQRSRDVLVLAAASDSGEMPALARAAAPLGLDVNDLVAAEAAALITVRDARVEFRHPLARSAVYGDAPAPQRRAAHRALAGVMPDTEADRRAWHLALAAFGPDDSAASALEQAGLRARQRSAYEVSSRAFERGAQLSSEEGQQARLLYAAADAAWLGGLADRAEALLGKARRDAAGDLLISIEQLRGHIVTRRGPVGEAQQILLAAADQAAQLDPDRAVVMLAEAVNASFYAGDAATMRQAASRAAALLPEDASNRTAFFASIAQGMALVFAAGSGRGAESIREAVKLLEDSDELRDDPRLIAWAAMGPLWLREADTGRALASRALATARRKSAVGVLPFVLTHVAINQVAATDRWAEAQASFHEAIGLARETGQRTELTAGLARLAALDARQGRSEQSRLHAAEALGLSRELGLVVCEVWALAALGDLELGLGREESALAQFAEQQDVLRERGIRDVDLSPAPELVELYLRLGRPNAAETAESYERDAKVKAQPWALARAARCRGLLATEGKFERHFTAALTLHDQTPDAFETARTHLAYGSRLRRGRLRVAAREQLRAAIEIFDRLGADPWSETARAELAATGETARRRDPSTVSELTPQELQIALRIAGGLTTREAAAALFLSPKTIEYHLRNTYRKFGIKSRSELVAAMTRVR